MRKEEKNNSQKKLGGLVEEKELAKWTNGLLVIKNKELGEKLDMCEVMETKRRETCKRG